MPRISREPEIAIADAFEIATVNAENRGLAVRSLRGHMKVVSIIWMKTLGLPLLDGVVVRRWSREAYRAIINFCRRRAFSEVLVRIDKKGQRWTKERGGFVTPVTRLSKQVRELTEKHFISILLEPASPYEDAYSFGAVCDPHRNRLAVEVVGPGFDASDILRSDIQPHERFEMPWLPMISGERAPLLAGLRRTYLVRPEMYIESVNERLSKISARIHDAESFGTPRPFVAGELEERRVEAVRFLSSRARRPLLDHLNSYEPVSRQYLNGFVKGIVKLMTGLQKSGIELGPTSVSASVVCQQRLVFWDFFPAAAGDSAKLFEC